MLDETQHADLPRVTLTNMNRRPVAPCKYGSGGGGATTSFELATVSPGNDDTASAANATMAKAIILFISLLYGGVYEDVCLRQVWLSRSRSRVGRSASYNRDYLEKGSFTIR
jgi:hypothetical protein